MKKQPQISSYKYLKLVKAVIIILMLIFSLQFTSAVAQSNEFAPVDIDGRKLFQVANTSDISAKKRAESINDILRMAVISEKQPEIKFEKGENYAKVLINNFDFTVTEKDTTPPKNPNQQAEEWAQIIRENIIAAQKERSTEFVRNTLVLSLIIIVLTATLHWVLGRIWVRLQQHIFPLVTSQNSLDQNSQQNILNILFKATLVLARTALWISVTLYITNLFPVTRQWSFDIAHSIRLSLTSPIFKNFALTDVFILIVLFLGLIVLAGAVTNILRSRILQVLRISRGAQEVVAIVFKYTLISIGSIILLQIFGIDLSSLAILASALGVGIGFGFQDIAKNFGSGLVLLFERPIQVGDFIEVGKYMGTVERIGARSVVIRTLDRVSIIVPNSRFLEDEVINWSHRNPISRIHVPVGVSYNSDVNVVKDLLLEVAASHPETLAIPQSQVFFTGLGESSLDFELLVWIDAPSHQASIKSDLYFRIEAILKKYNIEIPFPQRDLHLRSGDLPLKLSPELEQALFRYSQQHNEKNG